MTNKILLPNRYGDKNYLKRITDNKFVLVFDEDANSHYRVGFDEGVPVTSTEYYFVDPSGGPFIRVGYYQVNNKVVKRIYLENNNITIEI